MENFYWRNKVAVVTGASVGIGASTAMELANAGMQVVGLARRVELIRVRTSDKYHRKGYSLNPLKLGPERPSDRRWQDPCPSVRP